SGFIVAGSQTPFGSNVSPLVPEPFVEIWLQSTGVGRPEVTFETAKPMTYVLIGFPLVGLARSATISKDLSLYGQMPSSPPLVPSQKGRRSRFGSPSVSRMMYLVRQLLRTRTSARGPKQPTPVPLGPPSQVAAPVV